MKVYIQEVNLVVPDGRKAWLVKFGKKTICSCVEKSEAKGLVAACNELLENRERLFKGKSHGKR